MIKKRRLRLWPLVLAAAIAAFAVPVLFRAGPAEAGWGNVSWLIVYVSPANGGHVVNEEGYRLSGNPSVQPLPLETEAHLTAVPSFGYRFAGWSGDIPGSNPEIVAKLGLSTHLTANFSPLIPFWLIPVIAAAVAVPLLLLWRRRRARRVLTASEPPEPVPNP